MTFCFVQKCFQLLVFLDDDWNYSSYIVWKAIGTFSYWSFWMMIEILSDLIIESKSDTFSYWSFWMMIEIKLPDLIISITTLSVTGLFGWWLKSRRSWPIIQWPRTFSYWSFWMMIEIFIKLNESSNASTFSYWSFWMMIEI